MITTIKVKLTWGERAGQAIGTTSQKKLKQTLKDMTGAKDVEILDIKSWSEDESNKMEKKRNGNKENIIN